VIEFATKGWKKTTLSIFFNLKEQLPRCLSAISSGIQHTVVSEATDEWRWHFSACYLNENGCNMSSLNVFTLNG